jgi:ABC-type lipoprotein release transport system permease subunit
MKQPPSQYHIRIELLQGTLDMLILQTLQRGAQHGYGISQLLRARSSEVLQVETGPGVLLSALSCRISLWSERTRRLDIAAAAILPFSSGILAAWLPVRRASHIDPMQALRAE